MNIDMHPFMLSHSFEDPKGTRQVQVSALASRLIRLFGAFRIIYATGNSDNRLVEEVQPSFLEFYSDLRASMQLNPP